MRNSLLFLAAASTVLLTAAEASATPAPMSHEELLAASELVIHARGSVASCAGDQVAESEGILLTPYTTTVDVLEVVKGEARATATVKGWSVTFEGEESECFVTPAPIHVGFVGTLYLVADADGAYELVDWSGIEQSDADLEQSDPEALPVCESATPEDPVDPGDEPGAEDENDDADPLGSNGEASGGCSASGANVSSASWLIALALAITTRHSRRRDRSARPRS